MLGLKNKPVQAYSEIINQLHVNTNTTMSHQYILIDQASQMWGGSLWVKIRCHICATPVSHLYKWNIFKVVRNVTWSTQSSLFCAFQCCLRPSNQLKYTSLPTSHYRPDITCNCSKQWIIWRCRQCVLWVFCNIYIFLQQPNLNTPPFLF